MHQGRSNYPKLQIHAKTLSTTEIVRGFGELSATPTPPVSFFRPNEFDIGAFGTYVTGTGGGQMRTRTFADGDTVTPLQQR
jgi:hypothetical protein